MVPINFCIVFKRHFYEQNMMPKWPSQSSAVSSPLCAGRGPGVSDPLDLEADAGLLLAPGAPDGRDAGGGGEDARHAAPHLRISTISIVHSVSSRAGNYPSG